MPRQLPAFLRPLFDHNRYTGVALLAVGVIIVMTVGCKPTVISPISGQKVNRDQLNTEVESKTVEIAAERERLEVETDTLINALKAKYKALQVQTDQINTRLGPSYAELEQKENAIAAVLQQAQKMTAGTPYAELFAVGFGILATGFGLDSSRKNRVIERRIDPATVLASKTVMDPVAVQAPADTTL